MGLGCHLDDGEKTGVTGGWHELAWGRDVRIPWIYTESSFTQVIDIHSMTMTMT